MKPNILITGGSGLLGVNFSIYLRDKYNIFATYNNKLIKINNIKFKKINFLSTDSLIESLKNINPLFIIHCAALSNVDYCEKNKKIAFQINVKITENISISCIKLKIKLVYISTDHLFDGRSKMLNEDHPKKFLNYYSQTKSLAEEIILKFNKDYLIIRTNFFGWGTSYRKSFSDRIIDNLRANKEIHLFNDVYFTPILMKELFDKIHNLTLKDKKGIYNIVGNERISKYTFGMIIANIFSLNSDLIEPISINSIRNLSSRPYDMSLSNMKYCTELNDTFLSLEKSFEYLKKIENDKVTKEILCL